MNLDDQKRLLYVTKSFIGAENLFALRGVQAKWQNKTIVLKFYYDGKISDYMKEEASVLSTEILAQFPAAMLHEEYIQVDKPNQLPHSKFWAYIKTNEN